MVVQTDHSQATSQPHSTLPFTELHMAVCREGEEGGREGGKGAERQEGRLVGWRGRRLKEEESRKGGRTRGRELARVMKCC